jgi:hypothetical protein
MVGQLFRFPEVSGSAWKPVILIEVSFHSFGTSSSGIAPTLGHDRFPAHPLQQVAYWPHYRSTLHNMSYWHCRYMHLKNSRWVCKQRYAEKRCDSRVSLWRESGHSQSLQSTKSGHEFRGTRNQESLCCWGPVENFHSVTSYANVMIPTALCVRALRTSITEFKGSLVDWYTYFRSEGHNSWLSVFYYFSQYLQVKSRIVAYDRLRPLAFKSLLNKKFWE